MTIEKDKQGRPRVLIEFTEDQLEKLEPLFKLIQESDGHAGLLGQVMPDGMVVKFCCPDLTAAIAAATGATTPIIYSARQQL